MNALAGLTSFLDTREAVRDRRRQREIEDEEREREITSRMFSDVMRWRESMPTDPAQAQAYGQTVRQMLEATYGAERVNRFLSGAMASHFGEGSPGSPPSPETQYQLAGLSKPAASTPQDDAFSTLFVPPRPTGPAPAAMADYQKLGADRSRFLREGLMEPMTNEQYFAKLAGLAQPAPVETPTIAPGATPTLPAPGERDVRPAMAPSRGWSPRTWDEERFAAESERKIGLDETKQLFALQQRVGKGEVGPDEAYAAWISSGHTDVGREAFNIGPKAEVDIKGEQAKTKKTEAETSKIISVDIPLGKAKINLTQEQARTAIANRERAAQDIKIKWANVGLRGQELKAKLAEAGARQAAAEFKGVAGNDAKILSAMATDINVLGKSAGPFSSGASEEAKDVARGHLAMLYDQLSPKAKVDDVIKNAPSIAKMVVAARANGFSDESILQAPEVQKALSAVRRKRGW